MANGNAAIPEVGDGAGDKASVESNRQWVQMP